MLTNEMFLDSASLRSSIVSHAKQLGYEVSSNERSAKQFLVSQSKHQSTTLTMPAGTSSQQLLMINLILSQYQILQTLSSIILLTLIQ